MSLKILYYPMIIILFIMGTYLTCLSTKYAFRNLKIDMSKRWRNFFIFLHSFTWLLLKIGLDMPALLYLFLCLTMPYLAYNKTFPSKNE